MWEDGQLINTHRTGPDLAHSMIQYARDHLPYYTIIQTPFRNSQRQEVRDLFSIEMFETIPKSDMVRFNQHARWDYWSMPDLDDGYIRVMFLHSRDAVMFKLWWQQ